MNKGVGEKNLPCQIMNVGLLADQGMKENVKFKKYKNFTKEQKKSVKYEGQNYTLRQPMLETLESKLDYLEINGKVKQEV